MSHDNINIFNPIHWTALTWLGLVLWLWGPVTLNYPPSVFYTVNPITGQFSEPKRIDNLTECQFPVGWPFHYVIPVDPSLATGVPVETRPGAPVIPVIVPPPAPAVISKFAMAMNSIVIVIAVCALIYVLQRLWIRYSMRTLLAIMLGFAVYFGLARLIASTVGFRAAEWYANAIYFSPIAVAALIRTFGTPPFSWQNLRQSSQSEPTTELSISNERYESIDDQ